MTITLHLWHVVPAFLTVAVVLPLTFFPKERRPDNTTFLVVLAMTVGASAITGLLAQFAGRCA